MSRTHLCRLIAKYELKPAPSQFKQKLLYLREDFEKAFNIYIEKRGTDERSGEIKDRNFVKQIEDIIKE